MNLAEVIIWAFAVTLSIASAIGAYRLFGGLAAIGVAIIALLIGLVIGVGFSNRFYKPYCRRKRPTDE